MLTANVSPYDIMKGAWDESLREVQGRSASEGELRHIFEEKVKSILDDEPDVRANSVQSRARNLLGNVYLDSTLINTLFFRQRTETDIAPYGYYQRDLQMRRMFSLQGNSVVQSAVSLIVQKVMSCEWVIDGPQRTANAAQDIVRNADLGLGWEAFVAKTVQDYLTQDNGMFWEVVWDDGSEDDYVTDIPGPNAKIVGVAHLDAVRCRRTGDPNHPVIYQALTGSLHKLHRTRVIVTADMPNPNERYLGRGFCAFSRALAMAQSLVSYEKYRSELLDDVPPLGILTLSNINKAIWDKQRKDFDAQRSSDEQYYFRNILKLFNEDPLKPVDAKFIPFKQLWENFAEQDFYNVAIDLVAMAFDIDRQELAALSTSALGSAMQSNVLSAKGQGKGIGNVLTVFERQINQLLPKSCTFHFDYHDDAQDLQRTQIRDAKAKTIVQLYVTSTKAPTNMQGAIGAQPPTGQATPAAVDQTTDDDRMITKDEARRLLVRECPEWADIITLPNPEEEVQYDDTDEEALTDTDTGEGQPLAIAKMIASYGPRTRIWKSGRVQVARQMPITKAEREKARQMLKSIKVAS